MDPHIRVDIEELMEKLKEMQEDDFTTVELTINTSNYYDDFTLALRAVDISDNNNVEYGEIMNISDEF